MGLYIAFAVLGGVLVSLSRALNGRLSLATSALAASFWNHGIGFAALVLAGVFLRGDLPQGLPDAPVTAWLGGPLGVLFVASGSWLVARIGAAHTALMVIAGQMVSGVVLDLVRGLPVNVPVSALGVALILGGMVLAQKRRET